MASDLSKNTETRSNASATCLKLWGMISILQLYILSYTNKSNVKYLDMQDLKNFTSDVPLFQETTWDPENKGSNTDIFIYFFNISDFFYYNDKFYDFIVMPKHLQIV